MILLYEQVNNGNHIKGKSTHKTEPLNMNYRLFSAVLEALSGLQMVKELT